MPLEKVPASAVNLGAGPWRDRFEVNRKYVLSLENDAFLEPFHKAYAPPGVPEPRPTVSWGGWGGPDHDWKGHDGEFHGHYLSACAQIVALSGDTEIRDKSQALVAAFEPYQQTDGSLLIGTVTQKYLEDAFRGQHETVLFYVVHKLLKGLFELGVYADNQQALSMCLLWADRLAERVNPRRMNAEQIVGMLSSEHGGIAEILFDIAAFSGRQAHLDAALRFLDRSIVDPLSRGEDQLADVHANTTLPIVQGAARAYELTGEQSYRDAVENFWRLVWTTRTYATGSSSHLEYWRRPNALKATLDASTQETCVSFNWLRLTDYLLRWTGEAEYGDAYERCHINCILSAQHPTTGQFIYYLPMRPGPREPTPDSYDPDPPEAGCKHFGRPLRCFWCCYGTGVEAFADPATAVYYRSGDTVWINQFMASRLAVDVGGNAVSLEQQTDFPYSETARIVTRADRPTSFPLRIRIPEWLGSDAAVALNGRPLEVKPSSWLQIERTWEDGDTLELQLPMRLQTQAINDDSNCVAILSGPHVLAGCVPEATTLELDPENPAARVTADPTGTQDWVYHGAESSPGNDIRFLPISRIVDEEYHVYFETTTD